MDILEIIDEGLREMLFPAILLEKYYTNIGTIRILLKIMFMNVNGHQWPEFPNMVLQYLSPPPRPDMDMKIYDSDIIQFSHEDETFVNTWSRLVREHIHLFSPSIIAAVLKTAPIKHDNPDLPEKIYQLYKHSYFITT